MTRACACARLSASPRSTSRTSSRFLAMTCHRRTGAMSPGAPGGLVPHPTEQEALDDRSGLERRRTQRGRRRIRGVHRRDGARGLRHRPWQPRGMAATPRGRRPYRVRDALALGLAGRNSGVRRRETSRRRSTTRRTIAISSNATSASRTTRWPAAWRRADHSTADQPAARRGRPRSPPAPSSRRRSRRVARAPGARRTRRPRVHRSSPSSTA